MELVKVNEALNFYLRPQTFPVAVKMFGSAEEIPKKARQPVRDLGMPIPVCQGVALSRRYGWTIAMSKEDMSCPIGGVTLGFLPPKSRFIDGSVTVPNWLGDKEVRRKLAQGLPKFEYGKYAYLICAPLERVEFEPQAIIIYGNPAQIVRLVQGAVYETGELVTSASFGGGACASYITRTILTDQCHFILPSAGDRIFASTQDHEMTFALPLSKADAVIRGLKGTHEAGARYPTPTYLRYSPVFPPEYKEAMDYLKREGE